MEDIRPLVVNILAKSLKEQDLAGLVEKAALRAEMEAAYADDPPELLRQ